MENQKEKGIFTRVYDWFNSLTIKGALGAVLTAFVILIILLSLSTLPNIMGKISSSLSAALYSVFVPSENATVTADKKIINSGEDFVVSIKKGDKTDGIFTISYACDATVDLMLVESQGLKKIECDTQYYLLENENSIKIRPSTKESVVRLVLDASFENNETQKSEKVGVVRVTVKNDSVGTVVANVPAKTTDFASGVVNTNTQTYTPPVNQPAYYSKADLAVRILQTGLLNSATNQIINNQNQFSSLDMVGVRFEVRNDGDASTGPWSFTASLPSISTPSYNSISQISLRPGESIIYTLGFTNLTNQYSSMITISADPLNVVSESNESNNILTTTITNTSYNNSNYYNNNSNTGCYINGIYNSNCNNNNNNTNTGCYINGYFTYNCANNSDWNYNNNNNNYYNGSLDVSCYGDPSNPGTSERVRWYAEATGGNGRYTYSWSGTNGLDSTSQNPSKVYTSIGTKSAVVTVKSGGFYVSHTCSVYVD